MKGRNHATTQTEEKFFEDDLWAKTMTSGKNRLGDEIGNEGDDNCEINKLDATPQERNIVEVKEDTINPENFEKEKNEGGGRDPYANLVKFIMDEARERVLNALDTSVDDSVVSAPT